MTASSARMMSSFKTRRAKRVSMELAASPRSRSIWTSRCRLVDSVQKTSGHITALAVLLARHAANKFTRICAAEMPGLTLRSPKIHHMHEWKAWADLIGAPNGRATMAYKESPKAS